MSYIKAEGFPRYSRLREETAALERVSSCGKLPS